MYEFSLFRLTFPPNFLNLATMYCSCSGNNFKARQPRRLNPAIRFLRRVHLRDGLVQSAASGEGPCHGPRTSEGPRLLSRFSGGQGYVCSPRYALMVLERAPRGSGYL